MNEKNCTSSKVTVAWYRGLVPALIAGLGTYLITRKYQINGFDDGLTAARISESALVKADLEWLKTSIKD